MKATARCIRSLGDASLGESLRWGDASLEETGVRRPVRLLSSQAEGVFASRDKALLWLRTPDDRLDNRTPLKLLVTEAGARLVESLLQQIDEGIYV